MRIAFTLSVLCLLAAAPAAAVVLETEPHVYPVGARHRVHIEFPVGELKVFAGDEARIRFDVRVRCTGHSTERCQELANRLILDSDDTGNTLHLTLRKYPKWHSHGMTVIGVLSLPRALALQIEMGVGELDVEGIEGDIDAELGVGDANIRASRARAGNVSVETGVGDASIRGGGANTTSGGFIGSHARWSAGGGRSSVRLHVGVGDGTVRLE